jgi:hypothetical protein
MQSPLHPTRVLRAVTNAYSAGSGVAIRWTPSDILDTLLSSSLLSIRYVSLSLRDGQRRATVCATSRYSCQSCFPPAPYQHAFPGSHQPGPGATCLHLPERRQLVGTLLHSQAHYTVDSDLYALNVSLMTAILVNLRSSSTLNFIAKELVNTFSGFGTLCNSKSNPTNTDPASLM